MTNRFASALIACYHYMKANPGIGAHALYDAVNEAFCVEAYHHA